MANRAMPMILSFLLIISSFNLGFSEAHNPPSLYVFGDSLVDVGNNNYLSFSVIKAILPHYGIDFPTKKPTGRFSNGKNIADFIAENLGLSTSPPPYLSLVSKLNNNNYNINASLILDLDGVNFASGGAVVYGGENGTFEQAIGMAQQVDFYSMVHERLTQEIRASALQKHLSKSIFIVVIGSNDLFHYYTSKDLRNKSTPQQYVNSMVSSMNVQLQRLYKYGARKFVIAGAAAIGCSPKYRVMNNTECVSEANSWAIEFNEGLQSMLKDWQSKHKDLTYSFVDAYALNQHLIQNPTSYGFVEVKGACCGLGKLNADVFCLPISSLCSNRQEHVFWDMYHPTEAAARIFADKIYNGASPYISPLNLRQLVMSTI